MDSTAEFDVPPESPQLCVTDDEDMVPVKTGCYRPKLSIKNISGE